MKSEKMKAQFAAVILTLETQTEINKLYAIFNHPDIAKALELSKAYKHLDPFITEGWREYYAAISKIIKSYTLKE